MPTDVRRPARAGNRRKGLSLGNRGISSYVGQKGVWEVLEVELEACAGSLPKPLNSSRMEACGPSLTKEPSAPGPPTRR